MTTLMIVDDETIIRRGIHFHINWSSHDIEVVAEAVNGEDGLQKAIKHHPDIIISDIRMPVMNGLIMAERIKELLPDTKIIFISGYDDKEYLLGAIRNGAVDFVMKSANSSDILQAVLKCKEKIDTAFHDDAVSDTSSLMEYCFQNIRVNFMDDIISGKMESGLLLEQAQLLEVNLAGPYYFPLLLHTENGEDVDSLIMSLLFSFSASSPFLVWKKDVGIIGILNLSSNLIPLDQCEAVMDGFIQKHEKAQMLISHRAGTIEDLPYLLGRLVRSKEHLCWHAGEKLILLSEAPPEKVNLDLLMTLEQEILHSFSIHNYIDVFGKLEQFFSFFQQRQVPFCQYRASMERITIGIFSVSGKYEQALPYLSTIRECNDATLIFQKVNEMIQNFSPEIPHNSIVKMALQYIDTHYSEQISLNAIARHCCVTPSYISKIFKNNINIGIVQYIHNLRIEKAKELLLNSDLKVSEIATKVGYMEYKRFSSYFLKITGMSPREYKISQQNRL